MGGLVAKQGTVRSKHKSSSQEKTKEIEPSIKKARMEAVETASCDGDIAGGEEDLVSALTGLQRLVAGQTEDLARVKNLPDTCENMNWMVHPSSYLDARPGYRKRWKK